MRIGVISDIHSNIYALKAVLKDIENKNIDKIVCTGDLVGYHTHPNEVVDLIREKNIATVMGNHDLKVATGKIKSTEGLSGEALDKILISNYALKETNQETKDFLGSLPEFLIMEAEGKLIRVVHGSPRSITEYLKENSPEAHEVMKELSEDILLCGHSHVAYSKYYGDKLLINAGSIGKPKKGIPDSEYVIIEIKNNEVKVFFEEVPYDVESLVRDIEKSPLPNELGLLLKTGNKIERF